MKKDINSKIEEIKGYYLRIPFRMDHGKLISGLDELEPFSVAGYNVRIKKLKDFGDYHAIIVSSFDTKQAACDFFIKLRAALFWVSLKSKMGIEYSKSVEDAELPEPHKFKVKNKEIIIETNYSRFKPAIMPFGKKGYSSGTGSIGKGTLRNRGDIIAKYMEEGFKFPFSENVIHDEKLNLAIELYSYSFFDISINSRFITLVSVLEALTPSDEIISETSINALELAKKHIKGKRDKYARESEEYNDLNLLVSKIGKLKYQTIGTSMRNYIEGLAKTYKELGDPEIISDKLKVIYNNRSELLHNGVSDEESVKEGLQFLINFVPKLLEKLYTKSASSKKISESLDS